MRYCLPMHTGIQFVVITITTVIKSSLHEKSRVGPFHSPFRATWLSHIASCHY